MSTGIVRGSLKLNTLTRDAQDAGMVIAAPYEGFQCRQCVRDNVVCYVPVWLCSESNADKVQGQARDCEQCARDGNFCTLWNSTFVEGPEPGTKSVEQSWSLKAPTPGRGNSRKGFTVESNGTMSADQQLASHAHRAAPFSASGRDVPPHMPTQPHIPTQPLQQILVHAENIRLEAVQLKSWNLLAEADRITALVNSLGTVAETGWSNGGRSPFLHSFSFGSCPVGGSVARRTVPSDTPTPAKQKGKGQPPQPKRKKQRPKKPKQKSQQLQTEPLVAPSYLSAKGQKKWRAKQRKQSGCKPSAISGMKAGSFTAPVARQAAAKATVSKVVTPPAIPAPAANTEPLASSSASTWPPPKPQNICRTTSGHAEVSAAQAACVAPPPAQTTLTGYPVSNQVANPGWEAFHAARPEESALAEDEIMLKVYD